MPAMRLFGRRWAMGTDDIPLLAFPVACFQLLWAAALAAAVGVAASRWPSEEERSSSFGSGFSCEAAVATPFMAALGGLLATAVVAGALAAWATWEGLKGSILDVDLRRRVPPLVYALVASLAAEMAFLVFATVLASRPLPECAKLSTTAAAAAGVSPPPRHPWASPAVAVRALVFAAWGSVALLLLVAALASAAAPDPADEAAWAARCRCLVLACCPAAAVPGGGAAAAKAAAATAATMTKKVRKSSSKGGISAPSAGAGTTAAAAAAVVSSSAVGSAAGSPRGKRQRWKSFLWPFSSKRRRSSRQRRRTTSDAAAASAAASSNPVSPRVGAPPLQQQQLSLKQRTRSLDSTGAFDESDGEEERERRNGGENGENDENEDSNSEDDSDLEERRRGGNPAPPYQRLGVLFKQLLGHLDLVPTDIFAAFLLEARLQQAERAAGTLGALQEDEELLKAEEEEGARATDAAAAAATAAAAACLAPQALPRPVIPSPPKAATNSSNSRPPLGRNSPLRPSPPSASATSTSVSASISLAPSPTPPLLPRPLRAVSPAVRRSQQAIRDAAAVADEGEQHEEQHEQRLPSSSGGGEEGVDVERRGRAAASIPRSETSPSSLLMSRGGSSGRLRSPSRSPWDKQEQQQQQQQKQPSPSPRPLSASASASASASGMGSSNLLAPRPGLFARSSSQIRLSAMGGAGSSGNLAAMEAGEGGNGSGGQQQQQEAETTAAPSRPSTPVPEPQVPPLPPQQTTTTRMLTPSGMAARLRPDLDPATAALAAAARATRVELKEIGAATHVAHFAFAAYGYLLYLWARPRHRGTCELLCGGSGGAGSRSGGGCLLPRCRGLCGGGGKAGTEGASLSEDDDDDDGSDDELEGERKNGEASLPPSLPPHAFPSPALARLTGTKALTRAAILSITGIPASDLRFLRFRSEAADRATLPYFIALDRPGPTRTHGGAHLPPAVVLAIRGTLSASDVLTDALCEAERCDSWLNAEDVSVSNSSTSALSSSGATVAAGVESGDKSASSPTSSSKQQQPKKMYAHSGILAAAKAVAADVEAEGTLESLLIANAGRKAANEKSQKPWRVVVTGHSLGAGVAALVALRLRALLKARVRAGCLMPAFLPRDRPPNVACWSFAPPGGLACPALAAAAAAEGFDEDDEDEEKEEGKEVEKKGKGERKVEEDNNNFCRIVSVAVGKDWIPRLSLSAVERLRDDMVVAAGRCAAPKALLLLGWAVGYRWPPGKLFRRPSEVPPGARGLVEAFRETLLSRQEGEAAAAAAAAEAAALAGANAAASSSSSSAAAATTAEASASAAATVLAEREARLEGARSFVAPGRFMLLRPLKASVAAQEEEAAEAGKKKKKKKGLKKGDKSKANADDDRDLEAPPPSTSTPPPLPRHARAFEAVWVDHAALQREGILLSTRMALDHLPDYYISVLRRLSRGEYDGAGGGGAQPVSSLGPWDGTMMPPRGLFGDARNANANNNAAVAVAAAVRDEGEGSATTTTTATTPPPLPPPPPPPAAPVVALRGRRLSVGEGESRERRAAALEMQRRHRREQRAGRGKRGGGGGASAESDGGDGGPRAVPSAFGGGEEVAPAAAAAPPPSPPSAPGTLQAFGSYFPASPARPSPSSSSLPRATQAPPLPRNSTAAAATTNPSLTSAIDVSDFNNPALAELARRVSSQSEAEALADGGPDASQLSRTRASSKMRRDASSGLLSRAEEGRR